MQVKYLVEEQLYNSIECRNSDKRLLLNVWERQGLKLTKEQKDIFLTSCTTPEAITRVRRDMRLKYPADRKIEQARRDKQGMHRQGHFV